MQYQRLAPSSPSLTQFRGVRLSRNLQHQLIIEQSIGSHDRKLPAAWSAAGYAVAAQYLHYFKYIF